MIEEHKRLTSFHFTVSPVPQGTDLQWPPVSYNEPVVTRNLWVLFERIAIFQFVVCIPPSILFATPGTPLDSLGQLDALE